MSRSSRKRRRSRPDASRTDDTDEEGIGAYLWTARVVGVLLVFVLGGWASIADIQGAVIASGVVAVESNAKSVQHLDGGIIGEILVKDGDTVAAGDTLIALDSSDLEEERVGLETRRRATEAEFALIEGELKGLRELKSQGLVTNERLMSLERQATRLEGQLGTITAEQARVAGKLKRSEIRAPIGGFVHNLALHTVGGVVAAGQEILQIIPSRDRLIVEVRLDPRDVDQVRRGQTASLRMSSFNQRTTPQLHGSVTQVSADLVRDEARDVSYYTVRVAFDDGELGRLDDGAVVPGMPVEAFIQTDERSVLSYLVRPLTDHLARAFREE